MKTSLGNLFAILLLIPAAYAATNQCIECHQGMGHELNPAHQFTDSTCIACHKGAENTAVKASAHLGMVKVPGELANAQETCGQCHDKHVKGVLTSRMHTGQGIVSKTRKLFGNVTEDQDGTTFQNLGEGIGDSLLRKLCVSCHLGQARSPQNSDVVKARGGGCLACHLDQTGQAKHARLSARVNDGKCFGCHSRSGRISLNYAGLAEVEISNLAHSHKDLARLSDGRLVEKKTADIHHQAGMACIDCHTGKGLMNLATDDRESSVDIQCIDCHANSKPRLTKTTWPVAFQAMLARIPFAVTDNKPFLQTTRGTPLWHIDVGKDQLWLYPKLGGQPRLIPQLASNHSSYYKSHEKLTCQACHASWVPQCLGCHVGYDPSQDQWDHYSQSVTHGRWQEKRWDIGTSVPTLGWNGQEKIGVFSPGMIMTIEHPDYPEPMFIRKFAAITPHTTAAARKCQDCHQSTQMLGLGEGGMKTGPDKMMFSSTKKVLQDGLPADAWTGLSGKSDQNLQQFPRPFSASEIENIYRVPLEKNLE